MLRCSVTHTIVRVPELYRMVVAARSEDNRVGIHSRRTKPSETLNKTRFSHAHTPSRGLGAEIKYSMASDRGEGEELLSVPDAGSEEFRKPLTRSRCAYENLSEKFVVKERQYGRQYAQIYFARLMEMNPQVQEAAKKKWGWFCVCEGKRERERGRVK